MKRPSKLRFLSGCESESELSPCGFEYREEDADEDEDKDEDNDDNDESGRSNAAELR